MPDLRAHLSRILQGRVCVVGVGSTDCGDDGFGVRLAEALGKSEVRSPKAEGNPKTGAWRNGASDADSDLGYRVWRFGFGSIIVAGNAPERVIGQATDGGLDTVLFLDAAEFGAAPGSVVVLNSSDIRARFPQVSTHRMSLGLLAKWVEANGRTKAWLLAVQPESLKPGAGLTPRVQAALEILRHWLCAVLAREQHNFPRTREAA